ncbi:MAG TPA: penicillin-binding protein 2, partial [Acidimicrobiales bacterium]|nr:penicillin-binding protein 2 [Acidimicrobiales bacterium]
MLAVMGLVFAAILVRLADVQAVQAGRYAAYGVSERLHSVAVPALRGPILDRNGKVLAMSVALQTIYADPHLVSDPASEARQLAPALGMDEATLQKDLSADSGFVYLAHTVDNSVAAKVKALNLAGIGFLTEPKRFEPNGDLLSSVVGTVGYDGHGQSGLEYQYDSSLSGKAGLVQIQEGIGGQRIPGTPEQRTPAVNGKGLELTIDTAMQYEVEQAVARQVVAMHAESGTAVIVSSHTGQILALANVVNTADANTLAAQAAAKPAPAPTDPAQLAKLTAPAPSDSAFTQVYELGSVMKGVTISAALETGAVVPATRFTVPDSTLFSGAVIHDAEPHPTESWTVPDILSYSSNVGTLQISQRLGAQQIYRYMRAFGLGSTTGMKVPGESAGLVPAPSSWSGTSIATIPIGQGIAVTPMQMLDVYNTIANGGVFVPPRLIKGMVQADGSVLSQPPGATRRVVSAATARRMTAML